MGNKHGKLKIRKNNQKKLKTANGYEKLGDESKSKLPVGLDTFKSISYNCPCQYAVDEENKGEINLSVIPKLIFDLSEKDKSTIINILETAKKENLLKQNQNDSDKLEMKKVDDLIQIFKSGSENLSALLTNSEDQVDDELCDEQRCIEFILKNNENKPNGEVANSKDVEKLNLLPEISVISIQSIESLDNNETSVLSVSFTQSEKTFNNPDEIELMKCDSNASVTKKKSNILFYFPKNNKSSDQTINSEILKNNEKLETQSKLSLDLNCSSKDYLNSKNKHRIINDYNIFGVNLIEHLFHEKKKSIFFSPFNVAQGLSLCYIGAQLQTREHLDRLLNFKTSSENVCRENAFLKKCIKKTKESGKLVTLNQIYVHSKDDRTKFNQVYVDSLNKYYKSSIEFLNFDDKVESLTKINSWIGQKTKDKLKYLAEECDLHPKGIILINAIYFCGKWKTPFNVMNTKSNEEFRLSDGNVEKVDMMYQYNVDFNYEENFENLNASVCELPYKGSLSLFIILPHNHIKIAIVESKLNIDLIRRIDSALTKKRINIAVPVFKFHIKSELSGDIIKMGAHDLFLKNKANFNAMFEDGSREVDQIEENLCLTKVFHKAIIRVNETGSIGRECKSSEQDLVNENAEFDSNNENFSTLDFICNRPFLFFIKDQKTNLILFIGKYERK